MTPRRGGGRTVAAVAIVLFVTGCSTEGVPDTSTNSSAVPTREPTARPLDERDKALRAIRTADLVVSASTATGLVVTVANRGPNPGIGVVVVVHLDDGDLAVDDARCRATASGFRCSDNELLARAETVFGFRGDGAAGSVSVTHDGPERDPSDNTAVFG